jgi:ABC-type molybdate transport system substrate-binding protein
MKLMISIVLLLLSFLAILFMAIIGVVIFFHFRKFSIPKDKMAKIILNVFEAGSLVLVLLNVVLLAVNLLKK